MQDLGELIDINISNLITSKVEGMSGEIDSFVETYLTDLFNGEVYGKKTIAVIKLDSKFAELFDFSAAELRSVYSRFSLQLSSAVREILSKKIEGFNVISRFTDSGKTTITLSVSAK